MRDPPTGTSTEAAAGRGSLTFLTRAVGAPRRRSSARWLPWYNIANGAHHSEPRLRRRAHGGLPRRSRRRGVLRRARARSILQIAEDRAGAARLSRAAD